MMPAYVISHVEFLNEKLADEYRALAQATIAQYGGRYIVRGGSIEALEGEWPAEKRMVIVEFPTIEDARNWYQCPQYAEALVVREHALNRTLLLVDGVGG